MTAEEITALRAARFLIDLGQSVEMVIENPAIPKHLRKFVAEELKKDESITLIPAKTIVDQKDYSDWLEKLERSSWYYWTTLRQYLITKKDWKLSTVRSLDDSSDKILKLLAPPEKERFDIRGLVLGFVQSGKTANFTALIAKAADVGYRLIIVLSGVDNGLRRQTNIRLKKELAGYADNRLSAVPLPPIGKQWHEFTRDDIDGDFDPGRVNQATLQGSQPVLLVIKKNGHVLRNLLRWIDQAPSEIRRVLPMLVIDDEADQASIDTRGTYQADDDPIDEDYTPPSIINGLIRDLLNRFEKKSYVAYTATPYANILIPHDTYDPSVRNDLYPKDFIIDLPKPDGYFGAEEIFGRLDQYSNEVKGGMDIIRNVPIDDIQILKDGQIPESLEFAIHDFILAGAARQSRNDGSKPATMLIHTSQRILDQSNLRRLVDERFNLIRDDWRYQGGRSVVKLLKEKWESDFRLKIDKNFKSLSFEELKPHIGPFIEAVRILEINSWSGDVLNYELQPSLKAIAIGGNRLSRGLTLEGLLVSYFIRPSYSYDALMQMGRWFGFREGYADLTRLWTTSVLAEWFSDLARVEFSLREDIKVYENHGLKPMEVGLRILQHPSMQATGPLKRRFATEITTSTNYSMSLEQVFKFPFDNPQDLALLSDRNLIAVNDLISQLSDKYESDEKGPIWKNVPPVNVLDFLKKYHIEGEGMSFSSQLIVEYIQRAVSGGELTSWTIAIRGRQKLDQRLGQVKWGKLDQVYQISRSRIGETNSLGVVTSPDDETTGMPKEQRMYVKEQAKIQNRSENVIARELKNSSEGLLMIYPISKSSGQDLVSGPRRPLYKNPKDGSSRDLISIAISFPKSDQQHREEAYVRGTVSRSKIE